MSAAIMMNERRLRRRISFERPISILKDDGERLSLMAHDMSMEGIGFMTKIPINVGEILRVAVNIGPDGHTHVLNALGEVVHRRYVEQTFHIGMRFFRDI